MSNHLLSEAQILLSKAGIETAHLDSQLLMMHVANISREEWLMAGDVELNSQQTENFSTLIARRANREPLSHLLGSREFYGRDFKVTKDVLDPRPDTETLIDAVLEFAKQRVDEQPLNILDIGTGSGCIIITLLKEIENTAGVAIDISDVALKVAKENAKAHKLGKNLEFCHASMDDLGSKNNILTNKRFDIVVSNPPYIQEGEMAGLMPEVRLFEPELALNGGKDGLDCYRSLAKSLSQLLKANGLIFLEIGATQKKDVAGIFNASGWQLVKVYRDLAGHERCVSFKRESGR